MVNRILIRIKVVQMLYAYLLTRTEFKIDTEADVPTADGKFAQTAYITLLSLLLELTGNRTSQRRRLNAAADKKLQTSLVGKSLAADAILKELIFKQNVDEIKLAEVADCLREEIAGSAVFAEYKRKRHTELTDEVDLWVTVFQSIFTKNAELQAFMRTLPGYTVRGMQMAVDKVVATLKSFYGARASYYTALKALESSLADAHKLYLSMFVLIVRLTNQRERQLDNARNKFLATAEDKNPNTRFTDNALARSLERSKVLETYIKNYGIGWTDDFELLDRLLESIMNSQVYHEYMEAPFTDWEKDCEFWRQVMRQIIFQSDDLKEAIEHESVYWNDDLHIIGTFVLKTIRAASLRPDTEIEFLDQYKDEEDSHFGATLFEIAVTHRDEYMEYIMKFINTQNWDTDRIAFMDMVLMLCAVTEIINFPNIPLPVSLNEYIDIANSYSTAKSGQFINGVLYSVVTYLKENNIIFK